MSPPQVRGYLLDAEPRLAHVDLEAVLGSGMDGAEATAFLPRDVLSALGADAVTRSNSGWEMVEEAAPTISLTEQTRKALSRALHQLFEAEQQRIEAGGADPAQRRKRQMTSIPMCANLLLKLATGSPSRMLRASAAHALANLCEDRAFAAALVAADGFDKLAQLLGPLQSPPGKSPPIRVDSTPSKPLPTAPTPAPARALSVVPVQSTRERMSLFAPIPAAADAGVDVHAAASGPPRRVLFVGNSLTYSHDLPSMLQQLRASAGDSGFTFATVTQGGASCKRLWQKTNAKQEIATGAYDGVVLQEDLPETTVEMFEKFSCNFARATRLAAEVRAAARASAGRAEADARSQRSGAMVLYAAWAYARLGHVISDDQIEAAHLRVARENELDVAMVGLARRLAAERQPHIELYDEDREHPSVEGAYLAALVLHSALGFGSARKAGCTFAPDGMSDATAAALQAVADDAATVARFATPTPAAPAAVSVQAVAVAASASAAQRLPSPPALASPLGKRTIDSSSVTADALRILTAAAAEPAAKPAVLALLERSEALPLMLKDGARQSGGASCSPPQQRLLRRSATTLLATLAEGASGETQARLRALYLPALLIMLAEGSQTIPTDGSAQKEEQGGDPSVVWRAQRALKALAVPLGATRLLYIYI